MWPNACSHVVHLDLSSNNISSMPLWVSMQLNILNLYRFIYGLQGGCWLRVLNLSGCPLRQLPTEGLTSLLELDVSFTRLHLGLLSAEAKLEQTTMEASDDEDDLSEDENEPTAGSTPCC
jgi:hypothetical protein